MKKQKSLKKQMMTATLLALLCCFPFAASSISAQTTTNSSQSTGGGPQEGGDGPKRPKNCAQTRTCRPNNNSTTGAQSTAPAEGETESDWLESLWEWIFG